jgi:hypothetical protein
MVRFIGSLALGAAIFVVGAASAGAQTYMDLKGTWIGTGEAIVDGPSAHHLPTDPAKPAATFRLRHQTFTYRIEGQDGRRFWGSIASEHVTERLIGSLSANGKAVYMAGRQGLLDGEVVDADTIQMCYREALPDLAVVGCNEMKRQK